MKKKTKIETKAKDSTNEIKELLVPIAMYEAKSAFYKLKLAKVVVKEGSKVVVKGSKAAFKGAKIVGSNIQTTIKKRKENKKEKGDYDEKE